jgi:hypothetical protein
MGGAKTAAALAAALSIPISCVLVAEAAARAAGAPVPATSSVATPTATKTTKAPAASTARDVDPMAVKALRDMSAYLQTLSTFGLTSRTSLDLVARDSQRIQLDGVATYKVRKPNAFVIDVVSDDWNRSYIYNGHEFTLYAPKLGYFSTWPAPANIQATVAEVENRFGISLPLDDLFRWSGPDGARADSLQNGFLVGTETIDGAKTKHYAFREGEIDWQVWIQQGGQPLPLKLVIVDRRDPANPAYVARLTWTLNPQLSDEDFAFRPDKDAKRIRTILQR